MPRLSLVEKASGMTIADVLRRQPQMEKLSLDGVLMLCTHYRRVALCQWLVRLDVDGLFAGLANGAWLYGHWLAGNSDDAKRTSRLDPFFDAVVCGADEATQRIIAASRATWHQGREYEDDFCYARTLHACWSGHDDDAERQWARWRSVSGGGESRFVVCTALLARNAADLTDAVVLLLDEILAAIRERQAAESGDPDAAVTTDRLSLEGLALLRLAHRRGVPLSLSHVLLPDLLQLPPTVRLPDATAWRQVDDPRGLG